METNIISLDELDRAPRCISQSFRKSCAEACVKTLHELNHRSGSPLDVSGIKSKKFELIWNKSVTREILNTWTEQNYTTDHAAVGLSFLLVTKLSEYKVVQRSRTKTGFDYWLAGDQSQCDNDLPFRNAARLEISGIFRGKKQTFREGCKPSSFKRINRTIPGYLLML